MKSMIDDYFGQSPKGNKPQESQPTTNNTKNVTVKEPLNHDSGDAAKKDGKENSKAKGKGTNSKKTIVKSKPQTKTLSEAKKGPTKSKSLSTKKPHQEDGNSEKPKITEAVEDKKCTVQNFSLKIRLKSQEEEAKDNFIEDFSSPEQCDGKPKELKSPQSTMLNYFTSQKHTSPAEKDCGPATKVKLNRDISDYFSPTKLTVQTVPEQKPITECKPVAIEQSEKIVSNSSKKKNAPGNKKEKASSTPKSATKPKQKRLSISKTIKIGDTISATDNAEGSSIVAKPSSKVKSKSVKKSLSLTKSETNASIVKPSLLADEVVPTQSGGIQEPTVVAKLMSNALKKIMLKSSFDKTIEDCSSPDKDTVPTKKRKRDDNEDTSNTKHSKTLIEDSPVKSKRKLSCSNQINCDSDDDGSSKQNVKEDKGLFNVIDNHADAEADATLKLEDSKRNSLMSYFSKVSKEEVMAKDDKIEMKVKVMVHSPPTTPSKKTRRRSVNSLPGGAASLNKKKLNSKAKLKDNINAIDVIDVEESKGSDKNKNTPSVPVTNNKQPTLTSVKSAQSQSMKKAHITPQKNSLLKLKDVPNAKCDVSPKKTSRKTVSKTKGKLEMKNNVPDDSSFKSIANPDEENLATPLPLLKDETETSKPTSDNQKSWKLRVCLTPTQLPTTQGTLVEEESDCDDIFLQRKDKKRKLGGQCNRGKPKQTQSNDKVKERSSSPDIIFEKETCSGVKIAPLFTRKADSQARQLFLQSGVPDQVKRVLETQRSFDEQETEIFPKASHIQQKSAEEWVWNLPAVVLSLKTECPDRVWTMDSFSLSDLTGSCNIRDEVDHIVSASCKGPEMRAVFGLPMDIVKPILRQIKQESPDFKVVNTFTMLKSKFRQEEFSKAAALSALSEIKKPKRKSSNRKSIDTKQSTVSTYRAHVWTEKYKPCTATEIIGNATSIQQLKRWLEMWRKASEDCNKAASKEEIKRKKKRKDILDDDFVVSDNSSDGHQNNMPVGVAVLYGPNGSGKTSSVYALAKDLGYKVLEVNASEKRNGKLVLSKLSEATQSHQVQQVASADQGFAALFGNATESAKKNVKQNSRKNISKLTNDLEEDKTKKMSLILFEDVDIVFEEEDEGFLSSISNLVSTSKRPVILTTTDPESPMVSRFINSASLNLPFFNPPDLLTTSLQIVALLEGVYVASDTVKNLVSLCKGDFRKALLQMQLWVLSGANNMPLPSITFSQQSHKSKKQGSKSNNNDDLIDLDDDGDDCNPSIPANPDCIAAILGSNDVYESTKGTGGNTTFVKVPFPLDLGLFWWNSPPLLCLKQLEHAELPASKEDPPVLVRRMLDDSFIASFCSDDGNSTNTIEDLGVPCSQSREVEDPQEGGETVSCASQPSVELDQPPYKSFCSEKEMKAMFSHAMSTSSVDLISHSSQLYTLTNMEPQTRFSCLLLKDSLSLDKIEIDGPNCVLNSVAQEICHWLAEQSLNETRTCLCPENVCPSPYNYCLPSQEELRWRDAHAEAEQVALQAVPLCVFLERRAISTDYMPTLRTICRLERNRSIINAKRRNRFYHYLKSLGVDLSEVQLELLRRSMCNYRHAS